MAARQAASYSGLIAGYMNPQTAPALHCAELGPVTRPPTTLLNLLNTLTRTGPIRIEGKGCVKKNKKKQKMVGTTARAESLVQIEFDTEYFLTESAVRATVRIKV